MEINTKDEKIKQKKQSANKIQNNNSAKGLFNNKLKRNQPMILFDKVGKKYQNGVEAIKELSFRIEEGEFVFLMGSSGAGKSTLIKLILMEERADSGRILVNFCNLDLLKRRNIQKYRRSIGVFYQDFRLLEKKTVFQNVAFAMEITGASRKEIREKVDITLSIMGLSAKRNEYPTHLSGGEQQRVALARAIVNGPDILIADEPTGNLDPENSEQIMTLLKMINARGTTVLVATHEQNLADESGLRIIRLDHGKNVSKDMGDVDGYFNDTNNKANENISIIERAKKKSLSAENILNRKIQSFKDLYPKNKKTEEQNTNSKDNSGSVEPIQAEIPIKSISKQENNISYITLEGSNENKENNIEKINAEKDEKATIIMQENTIKTNDIVNEALAEVEANSENGIVNENEDINKSINESENEIANSDNNENEKEEQGNTKNADQNSIKDGEQNA